MFLYGTFLCLGDSTEAGPHSETVAMAKRLVLLTMEHIVVFKSCKWSGYKGKAPQQPPPLNHDSTGVFSPWHMPFTQHGKAFLSESLPPWLLQTGLWRHLWDLHIFQNWFCRGKRIHNDEALALVVRLGYFYRHFAFFYVGTRFCLTRLLVLSNIPTFHQMLSLRRHGRRVCLLFPTYISNMWF